MIRSVALTLSAAMSAVMLAACMLTACGGDADAPTPRILREEVRTLQREITNDLVLLALDEVEAAVAEDLPVRAAELLESGAIPAARRHARRVEALSLTRPEAQELRDEGAQLLQARADALEQYREALARGLLEDLALLEAIAAQRAAEEALGGYLERLEALSPIPDEGNDESPAEDREP